MSEPNCSINLTFYELPTPRFSFFCTSCSQGWHVQPDGSIHPPPRTRIIRISLGYPSAAELAGLQIVPRLQDFMNQLPAWYIASTLQVTVTPSFPPDPPPDTRVVTLDTTAEESLFFYRLAVRSGGAVHWDPDPKIYNDGSE